MLQRHAPSSFAPALLALGVALGHSASAEAEPCLIYLDVAGDLIEGAMLTSTLDAYLADAGYVSRAETITAAPIARDGWIEAARLAANRSSCEAVVWLEPATDSSRDVASHSHYLALYEPDSEGLALLPLNLPEGSPSATLRLVSATTRMALDTEVLLDVARTAAVAHEEPTPDPWPALQPAATAAVDPSPKAKPTDPAWRGTLAYRGDFSPAGIMSSHGPALGAAVRLGLVDLGLEVGMLIGPILRVEDMEARPLRLPVRLGGGVAWTLGRIEIAPGLRLLLEPVWMDAYLVQVGGDGEPLDPQPRLDVGAAAALAFSVDLAPTLRAFCSLEVDGMLVSHSYQRLSGTAIASNYVRVGWSAGFELGGTP